MDRPTLPVLEKAQSVENLETTLGHKPPHFRRNISFEDKWRAYGGQNHTAEMMDFIDDSDSWSQASFDSTCTASTEGHVSSKPYRTLSLSNFSKRSSLNDLSKLSDSMQELDKAHAHASPQSTPGLARRASLGDRQEAKNATDLQEKGKRGLSHSMILNWLYFKKYPTITEGGETPIAGSPVGDATVMDVAMKMGPATNPEALHEALKDVERIERKSLSFRDLNAVAPTNW